MKKKATVENAREDKERNSEKENLTSNLNDKYPAERRRCLKGKRKRTILREKCGVAASLQERNGNRTTGNSMREKRYMGKKEAKNEKKREREIN